MYTYINFRDKDGKAVVDSVVYNGDMIPIQRIPGTACVIWSVTLKNLTDLYLHNLEKSKRHDTFYLSMVKIKNYVDIPDNWYNFKGKFCRVHRMIMLITEILLAQFKDPLDVG